MNIPKLKFCILSILGRPGAPIPNPFHPFAPFHFAGQGWAQLHASPCFVDNIWKEKQLEMGKKRAFSSPCFQLERLPPVFAGFGVMLQQAGIKKPPPSGGCDLWRVVICSFALPARMSRWLISQSLMFSLKAPCCEVRLGFSGVRIDNVSLLAAIKELPPFQPPGKLATSV